MTGDPRGVDRRDLIDAARRAQRRVVAVTAPAGYGKTTLLTQWANHDPRTCATVSLTTEDDDPRSLVTTLATALAPVARTVRGHEASVRDPAAGVGDAGTSFVLLLDDVHALRSAAAHEVIRQLVAHVPPGSQVVTAGRHPQPQVPRWRVAGDVLELTERHLAFDARAVRAVFARSGMDIAETVAERLAQRTEGWPAVVYLGTVAARESRGATPEIAGDDRLVADYLQAEVYGPLTADQRAFLRRTSVLEQVTGDLADAVLERTDSAARLRQIEDLTRMVLPVGRGRASYRHHRLFREFLLAELRRDEPAMVESLHERAATWHEQHGSTATAVEHLLLTRAHDRTVRLVETTAPGVWRSGDTETVQRWLATFGDGLIAQYPALALTQAWVGALSGRPDIAERWLTHLEQSPDAASGPAATDRALLRSAVCREGPEEALADARFALEQGPHDPSRRILALMLRGQAHLLLGRTAEATQSLAEATAEAERVARHDLALESRATLAWIQMDRGHWDTGGAHARSAARAVEATRLRDHPASILAHAASARLHLHLGERQEAIGALGAAMAGRAVSTYARPFPAVKGRLETAKLLWATGDHTGARELVRELNDIFRERPRLGVLRDELDGFLQAVDATGDAHASVTTPLTPAELRVLPYLQTHLTIAQIGDRLFVSRNTANSEIASIYRKLGVSSRSAAVAKATVLGLLGQ